VRGFQGEILDQVGLRNLLAARVRLLLKDGKVEKAGEIVEELRKLKDFNEMNDELGMIERSILEQSNADVPRSARSQIDRMFKTTRDMLQKYLQEDVASTAAEQVRRAGDQGSAPDQPNSTPGPEAGATN
jgi:dihydroxyacetone kinase-like predicted kinase